VEFVETLQAFVCTNEINITPTLVTSRI